MSELVIQCPKCGKQDCIDVVIDCAIPVELYDNEAGWNWTEAEAIGEVSVYQCWSCRYEWQPNEMCADDFVTEVTDE